MTLWNCISKATLVEPVGIIDIDGWSRVAFMCEIRTSFRNVLSGFIKDKFKEAEF